MPTKKPAKPTAGVGTPRANALTTVPFTGEPPSPPASSAVTTRSASHDRTRTKQPFVDYQSPLKKLRTAMRLRRVIDTIDDTFRGRRFLRLYLGEHQAPKPLEQQQQVDANPHAIKTVDAP
ncbi:hypothetical protein PR002_g2301 [Phytophthora rubi]|uniref:Uncharacterized protein n=1 Tax=Phytophthora rubi TaxID=129364 RepID=A0A6A3NUX5_9STRA|nr:hypothetical protein PR002_g2301 [Phytophthora rubi]